MNQLKDIIINEDLIQYLEIVQISDRNKSIVKNYMNGISMNHLAVMPDGITEMTFLLYLRYSPYMLIKNVLILQSRHCRKTKLNR